MVLLFIKKFEYSMTVFMFKGHCIVYLLRHNKVGDIWINLRENCDSVCYHMSPLGIHRLLTIRQDKWR